MWNDIVANFNKCEWRLWPNIIHCHPFPLPSYSYPTPFSFCFFIMPSLLGQINTSFWALAGTHLCHVRDQASFLIKFLYSICTCLVIWLLLCYFQVTKGVQNGILKYKSRYTEVNFTFRASAFRYEEC